MVFEMFLMLTKVFILWKKQ